MTSRRLHHAIVCIAFSACAAEPHDSPAPTSKVTVEPLQLLASGEMVGGKTQEQWAIEYMRWTYAQTSCDDVPLYDEDGSGCASYQDPDSPVFFLEQAPPSQKTPAPVLTREHCHVPAKKAIFVPIRMVSVDDAGYLEKSPVEALAADARRVADSLQDLLLIADREQFSDLSQQVMAPVASDYYVPPAPNYFSCEPDYEEKVADEVVSPTYVTGAFAIFAAPRPGVHEIEYGGSHVYYALTQGYHVDAHFIVDSSD